MKSTRYLPKAFQDKFEGKRYARSAAAVKEFAHDRQVLRHPQSRLKSNRRRKEGSRSYRDMLTPGAAVSRRPFRRLRAMMTRIGGVSARRRRRSLGLIGGAAARL
jgi:hypothetical protein